MKTRPSLLAVTSEVPWPLSSGGHLRTYHLLMSLARRFDVRLVVPAALDEDQGLVALSRSGIDVHAVTIGPRRALSEAWRIADAALRRDPYVLYSRHRRRAVRETLGAEVARRTPDLLYLDHLDSFIYADAAAGAPIVIDMHNVYSTIAARASREATDFARRQYLWAEADLLRRKEQAAARTAHSIFSCSHEEAGYFRRLGARNVLMVPNGVDTEALQYRRSTTPGPPTVLFIGALEWAPNVSAVRFLARDVMPLVRARVPDAQLTIVGRRPGPEVLSLAEASRVEIIADVPDVRPYWQRANLLAVPLETGGGTRIKILEAFAAGVPVVSTPVGCEGISGSNGEHLLVAPRETFADSVIEVLLDPASAKTRAAAARTLAEQEYDWWAIGSRAAERLLFVAAGGSHRSPQLLDAPIQAEVRVP
jgi:glycosyltransferase involved in cell wall biosynthesis